jgi:3'-phosphoadenosine 5'-phosphosulfate sulfotransferase (PAPS reductase)/FAD synthetase
MDTTGELHLLSLSGGKDSVAAALYLREQGIEHERIFMDTGWEHPQLYAHLDYLEEVLGPIHRVAARLPDLPAEIMPEIEEIEALVGRSPSAFVRWVVYKGMFPSRIRRFCTRSLKVDPFLKFVKELDADIVNVVGVRAAESRARSKLPERELMPGQEHIEVWRPLIRWSEEDVIDIHQRHNITPCALYLRGARRVGCWPCIQSNKAEVQQVGEDPQRMEAIRRLEALATKTAAARKAAKGEPAGNPPGFFQDRRPTPEGKYPCVPIDSAVEWANTQRGGRQMMIDASWGREAGCVRWGMCETLPENER